MASDSNIPSIPTPKPMRILVAEDSPLNQQVALKQLEKLGCEADAVADGNEVLTALERKHYDIILMDCQMPEMNGYDAAWRIRDREKEKNQGAEATTRIYIIAMTANTEDDNRERCEAAGMDGYINKPVQLPELEAALLRALADRAATRAAEEIIDPVVIAGLRQLRMPNKPDPLAELIDLFLKEAPAQLSAMQEAISRKDDTSLARTVNAATRLRGSASNLGARNLAALADEIEQTAKNWSLAGVPPLVERANVELARVREVLDQIKRS